MNHIQTPLSTKRIRITLHTAMTHVLFMLLSCHTHVATATHMLILLTLVALILPFRSSHSPRVAQTNGSLFCLLLCLGTQRGHLAALAHAVRSESAGVTGDPCLKGRSGVTQETQVSVEVARKTWKQYKRGDGSAKTRVRGTDE